MDSSGAEALAVLDLHAPSSAALHNTNLPDDHCVCCSPLVVPAAPVVPLPALATLSANDFKAVVLSGCTPLAISASPPSPDPAGFDRPLRL
jgi:hypothetical protein